jgi:hypothetical protein
VVRLTRSYGVSALIRVVMVFGASLSILASSPGRDPGCSARHESNSSWATVSVFAGSAPRAALRMARRSRAMLSDSPAVCTSTATPLVGLNLSIMTNYGIRQRPFTPASLSRTRRLAPPPRPADPPAHERQRGSPAVSGQVRAARAGKHGARERGPVLLPGRLLGSPAARGRGAARVRGRAGG